MITGEKTVIKGITKENSTDIYNWVNREELRNLTGTLYPVSEYEHEEWIKRQTTSSDRKLFVIYDKENDRPIGSIGLKNIDTVSRNAELFICIGDSSAPEGCGSDAVSTFVKYCFLHLNFHKIYLHVFESNPRAIRCYQKAGFKMEGELKEHHFQNGAYETVFVMGMVADA